MLIVVHHTLYECYGRVRENLETMTNINKRYYDLSATKTTYKIGDWVWFDKPRHMPYRTPKSERFISGPYRIMSTFDEVNVVIQQSATSQPILTHIDKLKPFVGNKPADFTLVDTSNEKDAAPSSATESPAISVQH
jgi:hypothetical protein